MSQADQLWMTFALTNVICGAVILMQSFRIASFALTAVGIIVMLIGNYGIAHTIAVLAG